MKNAIERLLQPDENGLLPCPFCGGAVERKKHKSLPNYVIRCARCKVHIHEYQECSATVEQWNTRACAKDLRSLLDLNKKLAEALKEIMKTQAMRFGFLGLDGTKASAALSAQRTEMGEV